MAQTSRLRRPPRRGPVEGEAAIGIDSEPGRRPGVPKAARRARVEAPREGLPEQADDRALIRAGLDQPTPVYGTAQPPRGLSGALRHVAYSQPEHLARHWMLLLLADRVDALEDDLGELLSGPLETAGMPGAAEAARRSPLALLAGVGVTALLTRRILS